MMEPTYSTAEVTKTIGAPSERWLLEQIRSGRFPARRIGRSWRMTDSDVAAALDTCLNRGHRAIELDPIAFGLTPRSRRRVIGR